MDNNAAKPSPVISGHALGGSPVVDATQHTEITKGEIVSDPESQEEKEIQEVNKVFRDSPKLARFAELFFDKNNKATYGNKTESAMQAYNPKNRVVAGQMGVRAFKKVRGLTSQFLEDKGMTVEKLMDLAMAKALSTDNKAWWDELAIIAGAKDEPGAPIINNNTQNNFDIDINSSEIVDYNKNFKKFLESQ